MQWDVVIGIETHVQLATASKIFSGSATRFGAAPNEQANEVDMALPGVLPVVNARAVELAIRFGLAVQAEVASRSIFARKNYFYPDLPKGYQISQYEEPVVVGGSLTIAVDQATSPKTIRLVRAHLEEDAGKSVHEGLEGCSGIDLNRAGTPLLEIVTYPDLFSSAEAVAYAKALHRLVVWLGICDGNMQEGSFRCDANVSVKPRGVSELGTRCEIKNLNSFRFLQQAIDYEVRRQIEVLEDGGRIIQETRLYDPDRDETRAMRSKEDAHDYRYFPDPDLPPVLITASMLEAVKASMPELPAQRQQRYQRDYALSDYDAAATTATRETADFFDACLSSMAQLGSSTTAAPSAQVTAAKSIVNWLIGDIASYVNRTGKPISALPITPAVLAALLGRIQDQTITQKAAKQVFQVLCDESSGGEVCDSTERVDQLIEQLGLAQSTDEAWLLALIDTVLAANAGVVEEFKAGKEKAFNALIGQVMMAAKGKAPPAAVQRLLRVQLGRC